MNISFRREVMAAPLGKAQSSNKRRLRVTANSAKRVRVNYPAASETDVETAPACHGFNLVAFLVTGIEAVLRGLIAADADPSLLVAGFVGDDLFLGRGGHALTVPRRAAMSRARVSGGIRWNGVYAHAEPLEWRGAEKRSIPLGKSLQSKSSFSLAWKQASCLQKSYVRSFLHCRRT